MKNECYIVRDLLPLYNEDMVSDETAVFVREHLEKCGECSAEFESMKSDIKLCEETIDTKEQRMQEAAVLTRIERTIRKDKLRSVAVTAFCIIFIGVLGVIFWTDIGHRSIEDYEKKETENVVYGPDWIRKGKKGEEQRYKKIDGEQLTLEEVIRLSEKGDAFSWKDLQKYNFYEILKEDYHRIYEIEDFDRLFELRVSWVMDGYVEYPHVYDATEDMELLEAVLIAKDGLGTQVDLLAGDVKAYIKEHQDNPTFQSFSFSYFPAEVEGTTETLKKFAELVEEGEEILPGSPEEITAVKIDSTEEMNTFVEKMQYELKYTDKTIGENVYAQTGLKVGELAAEPQFLLYISRGNLTHEYHVANVERYGEDLYISIEKSPRKNQNVTLDSCLIGLSIAKDGNETTSVKGVTRVHLSIE